jgi:hypothetical protein
MKRRAAVLAGVYAFAVIGLTGAQDAARSDEAPHYTAEGRLTFPANYREWIYLSSGLGMSYSAGTSDADPSFDNVFVSPAAYRGFQQTGTWPDKTILVLEVRSSRSRASINQSGHFQSGVAAVEAEVKDKSRFPGNWAFFSFGADTAPGRQFPAAAPCYSCHAKNAAVDNTFVQFYPTLLPVAKSKGTLKPEASDAH